MPSKWLSLCFSSRVTTQLTGRSLRWPLGIALALSVLGSDGSRLAAAPVVQELEVERIDIGRGPNFPYYAVNWLVAGPDGHLWFTSNGYQAIGRLEHDRRVTFFPVEISNELGTISLGEIIVGPDQRTLWFVQELWPIGGVRRSRIGRITASGEFLPYIPLDSVATHLAAAVDGSVWVSNQAVRAESRLYRIGPDETVTSLPLPVVDVGALDSGLVSALVTVSDRSVWFSQAFRETLGRVDANNRISEFRSAAAIAQFLTEAPNGGLWFLDHHISTVTYRTASGALKSFLMPLPSTSVAGAVIGPDGNFWYVSEPFVDLFRVTPDGDFTPFLLPAEYLGNLVVGPDKQLWVPEYSAGSGGTGALLRIAVPSPPPKTPRPPPPPPRLYTASQKYGNIAAINLPSGAFGTVDVTTPFSLSDLEASVDGRFVYVVLFNAIQVLDTRSHKVVRTIPYGGDRIAMAPNGRIAYLTLWHANGGIFVIDTQERDVIDFIPIPCVLDVSFSPDSTVAYVTQPACTDKSGADALLAIDTTSGTVLYGVPVNNPRKPSISPDGLTAFVPSEYQYAYNGFVEVDLVLRTVVNQTSAGGAVTHTLISPDGQRMYAVRISEVRVYDTSTRQLIGQVGLDRFGLRFYEAADALLTPDGSTLFLTDGGDGIIGATVLAIDTASLSLRRVATRLPDETIVMTLAIPPPPPGPSACVGDCGADHRVTVEELIAGVRMVLGNAEICTAFDPDGDATVSVSDLVAAVNAALYGCVTS